MKKHEAIQHYKALSTNMLIADYVYCLQQNRKAAIAINSSLMLMFNGHKKLLDDNYIKEKVNYAVFESKHFFVIQDEIKKRVGE